MTTNINPNKQKHLFQARLHIEKRREEFIVFREALREAVNGHIRDQDLWRIASFKFPPLDGSPHEIPMTPQLESLIQGTDLERALRDLKYDLPPAESTEPATIPMQPPSEDDFWLDGDLQEPPASPPEQPLPQPTAPVHPKPAPSINPAADLLAQQLAKNAQQQAKAKVKDDEVWEALAAAVDRKKRAPILETAEWIYHNIGTPLPLIDPAEIPSAGALSHLRTLRENKAAYLEFLKTWMVKTIPDKKQMDFEAKRNLGSVKVLSNLDAFDEQFAAEHTAEAA